MKIKIFPERKPLFEPKLSWCKASRNEQRSIHHKYVSSGATKETQQMGSFRSNSILGNESGTALFVAIIILLIFTFLGRFALGTSDTEIKITSYQKSETISGYISETGNEHIMNLFNNPYLYDGSGKLSKNYHGNSRSFFKKQLYDGDIPYFNLNTVYQFNGTEDSPDLEINSSEEIENLFGIKGVNILKIYKGKSSDAICTIESIGITDSGGQKRIVQEIISSPITAINSPFQSGKDVRWDKQVLVHWGDIRVEGDIYLNNLNAVPAKTNTITTGSSYKEMATPVDSWIDIFAKGDMISSDGVRKKPDYRSPDKWKYEVVKDLAKRYGSYYTTDKEGRIFLNGKGTSVKINDTAGFVFIDTIDGLPPGQDNLSNVTVESDYLEGILYINANVTLIKKGWGKEIEVKSPPPEGSHSEDLRDSIRLKDININGLVYSNGSITINDEIRMFGGIYAENGYNGADNLEIWFNHDLKTGYMRGLPVVVKKNGSWLMD